MRNKLEIKQETVLCDKQNGIEYRTGDTVIIKVNEETYTGKIYSLFKTNSNELLLAILTDNLKWFGKSVCTTLVNILVGGIQEIKKVNNE